MLARHRHRVWRVLGWGMVVVLASLAGGIWFAFNYLTSGETIARVIKAGLPRYLPHTRVEIGRARTSLVKGEIHISNLLIQQVIDGQLFPTLRLPWLRIRHNPRAMVDGRFEPTEVAVSQPTLRLIRRKDGSWNLDGLLADPWPGPPMNTPPIQILNGTVELYDADDPTAQGVPILRDVAIQLESAGKGKLAFEGTAKGDMFDRIGLAGTVDIETGRVEFSGDLTRLAISDALRDRLPAEYRREFETLGLNGGEVDLQINTFACDPKADRPVTYDLAGHLRNGVWNCSKLPFPINDLASGFTLRDGRFTIDRAEGFYGTTTLRVERAACCLDGADRMPFDVDLEVIDLELDPKLREWVPPEYDVIWNDFAPSGRLSASVKASRTTLDGPVQSRVVVDCHDISMLYRHFKYPVDHVRGRFIWENDRVVVQGMNTLIGGRRLTASGTVDHPGLNAIVHLEFTSESLPIDKTLLNALPADVREVVDQFQPTGTVHGTASVRRYPPAKPDDNPIGIVKFDAMLDLDERCGIVWAGMPYPVNNLTGRLEIHPERWIFKNMRGRNGQAEITGSGDVRKVGPGKNDLNVDLHLKAVKLPFDEELRGALPPAWQKSWATLDPFGSSSVDATIKVLAGQEPRYHLVIVPGPASGVRLHYSRPPNPGVDPGGTFELRMEDVTGTFVFDNGPVEMSNVGFRFHGAPVRFTTGTVTVEDSGKFMLGVNDLWVKEIRLDNRLRKIMPPVMDQFARRFDDGRTFTLKGNLGLAWSGVLGEPVRCGWHNALVVFNDNAIQIQPGLSLEHIQGKLDSVRGWSDGSGFEVHGAMRLESVSLLDQQITGIESPIDVDHGVARLDNLRGNLLGGELTGKMSISLDATPNYQASLNVRRADLQQYAKTVSGHQKIRGLVDAALTFNGLGGDLHTLQGNGEAHVINGDIGELPMVLRLAKIPNLSPLTKTAFDSADIRLVIRNGISNLDPIRFTGNAFSLQGWGTMDVQGELDMTLRVLYGRDNLRLPFVSDAMREASGQFLVIRVQGTPSYPKIRPEPLPKASDVLLKSFRGLRGDRDDSRRR